MAGKVFGRAPINEELRKNKGERRRFTRRGHKRQGQQRMWSIYKGPGGDKGGRGLQLVY